MNKIIFNISIISLLFLTMTSLAQEKKSFKGKINYSIEYKFFDESSSNFQLMDLTGSNLIVYYTDGFILNLYPQGIMEYVLYDNLGKRSYQKFRDNDTIYYVNTDKKGFDIRDYEIVENSAILLNKQCNSLILYFETGPYLSWEETYSPEIYYDPANAVNYAVYNYNFIYSKTRAIPLRTILQNKNEQIEYLATDIYPGDDKNMFSQVKEFIMKGVVVEMK